MGWITSRHGPRAGPPGICAWGLKQHGFVYWPGARVTAKRSDDHPVAISARSADLGRRQDVGGAGGRFGARSACEQVGPAVAVEVADAGQADAVAEPGLAPRSAPGRHAARAGPAQLDRAGLPPARDQEDLTGAPRAPPRTPAGRGPRGPGIRKPCRAGRRPKTSGSESATATWASPSPLTSPAPAPPAPNRLSGRPWISIPCSPSRRRSTGRGE